MKRNVFWRSLAIGLLISFVFYFVFYLQGRNPKSPSKTKEVFANFRSHLQANDQVKASDLQGSIATGTHQSLGASKMASSSKASPNRSDFASADDFYTACWAHLEAQAADGNRGSRYSADLDQVMGKWYFSTNENERESAPVSLVDKMMQALAMSDLLVGKSLKRDDDEALRLLKEVSQGDPGNSAPHLFSAVIEFRRQNLEQALLNLAAAKNTNQFDTYMTTIAQRIYGAVNSGLDLVEAVDLWRPLAVPDYLHFKKYLSREESIFFAKQMMQSGLDKNAIVGDVDWFVLDYATGASLFNNASHGPKAATVGEIIEEKEKRNPIGSRRFFSELEKKCDLSTLDKLAIELRNHISSVYQR